MSQDKRKGERNIDDLLRIVALERGLHSPEEIAAAEEAVDHLRREEKAAGERKMRLAGVITAAVGCFVGVFSAIFFITIVSSAHVHFTGFDGEPVESLFWQAVIVVYVAFFAAVLIISGLGFCKRKEWARRLMVGFLWVMICLCGTVAVVLGLDTETRMEMGGDVPALLFLGAFTALEVLFIWLVKRFFSSAAAKAWCARATLAAEPASSGKPAAAEAKEIERSLERRMKTAGRVVAVIGFAMGLCPLLIAVGICLTEPEEITDLEKGLFSEWFGYLFALAFLLQVLLGCALFVAGLGFLRRRGWARRTIAAVIRLAIALTVAFAVCILVVTAVIGFRGSLDVANPALATVVLLAMIAYVLFWTWLLRLALRYFTSETARYWCAG